MIFLLFLLASIFLDSNFFSVPLVFIASLLLIRRSFVRSERLKKESPAHVGQMNVVINAIVPLMLSLVLLTAIDAIRLERIGASPLLYLASVTILIIYGRFFELGSSRFFAILLAVITFAYAYITGYDLFSTAVFLLILIVAKWILAMISHEKD